MITIPGLIEKCDHCSKKVAELLIDSDHWHLCRVCWPLYHAYEYVKDYDGEAERR